MPKINRLMSSLILVNGKVSILDASLKQALLNNFYSSNKSSSTSNAMPLIFKHK